ncbi:ABC transporter permease [Rhizobium sp. XQZ8]|uniref:ABC transporter permease n=1 Tax=Rhizobium populisoli TaxID=2859785 RepID=UPI001C686B61|nr:ABC transporter permease [Rhizobium populisoli]MBW6422584.1 ABC transporter permease [Rhizobium populisoli]
MTVPQSKPMHRRWFNPSIARYMEAFTTTRGIAALTAIILISALAFLAPVVFPGGYDVQSRESLRAPSFLHFFGTDELGRDLFVRSIYGLRSDLALVYFAVPVSMVAGTLLGLIGAVSPRLGSFVQRCLDIIVGFPGLILGICVVLVLGAGWTALLVVIVVSGLPGFGRLARATLLSQQQREYVIAARTLGVGKWQIMVRHILPNAVDPIIVQGAVFVVSAIFIEAALSIVGLGLQPPEPSLGTLLNNGIRYISRAPTYVLGPTVILIIVALAFSMLADALNATVNRK